jgi:type II secretory ATPase GspE/PulE/Tfp pilus assembly ATPase PilB-like protein
MVQAMKRLAAEGLVTLQEQGFERVIEGKTDLDEWIRVVT